MLKINVPSTPWSEQSITLNGVEYRFIFTFNERDQRWRLDIYLQDTPIILGVKVMENELFLYDYDLDLFAHGDIACFRVKKDQQPVGFDNLGFGKAYEIFYITNAELLEVINAT